MSSRRSATPASKAYALETALNTMPVAWEGVELELMDYRGTGTYIMQGSEEMMQLMEDQLTMTQAIAFSPFKGVHEEVIGEWDKKLDAVSEVIEEWLACQRNWMYLEPIFSSDDTNKQLPLEPTRFNTVHQKWEKNMAYCELLDEFLHMLPDEEDKWRWTTYSWPLKMEEEIEKGIERCEESENAFQSMMVAKQQSFAKEI